MAFTRNGYGQVEPNQLSAQKTGQIYASLPLDKNVNVLENGTFMYYDMVDGKVTASPAEGTPVGEPMLVFNEVKLYDTWRNGYKDFAMIRKGNNYVTQDLVSDEYGAELVATDFTEAHGEGYRLDGFAPRLFKTNIGDIMTTNMVDTTADYAAKEQLVPQLDSTKHVLVLKKKATPAATDMVWVVVKVYTMPDGQPGLKLQRIQ